VGVAAQAWILTDSAGYSIAVAEVEMTEYLIGSTVMAVPFTPDYCPSVMPWRGRLLPVMHYSLLFESFSPREQQHIGVLAYQVHPGEPLRHVALALGHAPYRIAVTEQESEALPELYAEPAYRPLVRSVLRHNGEPVPVIDVNYLVSIALRDSLLEKTLTELHAVS